MLVDIWITVLSPENVTLFFLLAAFVTGEIIHFSHLSKESRTAIKKKKKKSIYKIKIKIKNSELKSQAYLIGFKNYFIFLLQQQNPSKGKREEDIT